MQIVTLAKNDLQILKPDKRVWVMFALFVFVVVLIVPVGLQSYDYSPIQLFLTGILGSICLYPSAAYLAKREAGLPVFPLLCLAYGLQFALPILTREATIVLSGGVVSIIGEEDVVASLLLSILGVVTLNLGYYGLRTIKITKFIPLIDLSLDKKKAIIYCLIMGIGLPLIISGSDALSSEVSLQYSAIIRVLNNQILVSIGIITGLVFVESSPMWLRLLLYFIFGFATARGIATGFLENAVAPLAVFLMMKWASTKKLPVAIISVALLAIVFLSPVKQDYRTALSEAVTVDAAVGDTAIERAWYWLVSATDYWGDALSGQKAIEESADIASSRLDLIHQFAHIYSMTPSVVPFQNGATYSYFLIAFIPRFLWPDKPGAGGANTFYAVNYNITTEEGARRSSFGMSLLAESFINFGWLGIVIVMALQGAALYFLQTVFSGSQASLGGQAIFVAFFVSFLNGIGSSAEIMFGNILQSLVLSTILLWWIRKSPSQISHTQPYKAQAAADH